MVQDRLTIIVIIIRHQQQLIFTSVWNHVVSDGVLICAQSLEYEGNNLLTIALIVMPGRVHHHCHCINCH